MNRFLISLATALLVLATLPPLHGQQDCEAQIREWTSIDFGGIRFADFRVIEVQSRGRAVNPDYQHLSFLVVLRGGSLSILPGGAGTEPAPVLPVGEVQ